MKADLDEYSRNARLKPAFIVILPLALTAATLGFKESAVEGVLLGLASSLGLTFLMAQLVRDSGKSRQQELFRVWGGKPSTAMLRHGDARINAETRNRYHSKLRELIDLSLPTRDEQLNNPSEADKKYESCGDYLLSQTRDQNRFGLLFQENINYGFRRNLWAMKPTGVAISAASVFALAVLTIVEARMGSVPWFANLTATGIASLLLVWWLLRIKPQWVKLAADAYALRLLASIDELVS